MAARSQKFLIPFALVVACALLSAAQQQQRIVSLVPALTEMLFAIGAGSSVIGVSNFDAFPPSAKRDYLDWVTGAKRTETRASRIAQAADWIAEGKKRHWKYEKC